MEEAKDDLETLSGIVEEKITKPDITGISGQVLGLDDNLNPKWINQSVNDDTAVRESTETGIDLDVSDAQGNIIIRLSGGHIQTKEFDSSEIAGNNDTAVKDSTMIGVDLDISDNAGDRDLAAELSL